MIKLYFYICDTETSTNNNYPYFMNYNGWYIVEDMNDVIDLYFDILPKNEIIKILKEKIDNNNFVLKHNENFNRFGTIDMEIPNLSEEEIFYLILKHGKEKLIRAVVIKEIGD